MHAQLVRVFEMKAQTLSTPYEMAFTSGYLSAFTFVAFSNVGCKDVETQLKYIEHFCNGVLPKRLWEVFRKGKELNDLSQAGEREEFVKTRQCYELGSKAGINDAGQFLHDGVLPSNLENFLTGKPVEGADF